MTKAHTSTKISKGQNYNTNNATKCLITQRLWTDLGRSVGVATATKLVRLTLFTGPTFPLPAIAVLSIGHTFTNLLYKHPYIDTKPTATPSGEVIKIDTRKAQTINR